MRGNLVSSGNEMSLLRSERSISPMYVHTYDNDWGRKPPRFFNLDSTLTVRIQDQLGYYAVTYLDFVDQRGTAKHLYMRHSHVPIYPHIMKTFLHR